jgi:hypothetical protein
MPNNDKHPAKGHMPEQRVRKEGSGGQTPDTLRQSPAQEGVGESAGVDHAKGRPTKEKPAG